MPHRLGLRTVLFASAVLALPACDKDKLTGPEAEVKKTDVKLDLPAVPAFELPPASPDAHSVKELRVKGKKLFDSEITVKGIITWKYDCPTAIRPPNMSDKDVAKMIEDDPTKCERAKFYVGDTKDTPIEKSLWVVDVPRPFNKQEIANGGKDQLKNPPPDRCDPKDPKKSTCPPYEVGDQVTITGDFKMSSPHSERNSDGLLVYKKMNNVTQAWTTPPPDPLAVPPGGAPPPAGAPPAGAKPSPSDLVKKKPA